MDNQKRRNIIQFLATLLTNIHIFNFFQGKLYTGDVKRVCVPGLNCYSCPAATGACPIGSFQAVAGSAKYRFSYYISGILILIGIFLGRVVCGFLCPFGWFQDLIHRIPVKKFSTKKLRFLCWMKYIFLVAAVMILPVAATNNAGVGAPFFCKYICPQGILEGGIPLSLGNRDIAAAVGVLFRWKLAILVAFVLVSSMIYRPFCKWVCPLGAVYSLFNRMSFVQYQVNGERCISCGRCARGCRMDVDMAKTANARECIRCGECIKNCPVDAISVTWGKQRLSKRRDVK